ncbi:FAD-binding domain-containing protein [Stappia indica]|uniref:FAD-binding domain-containing protein n=1 Tax=Stappia indica TaxID=538381 RepID=UPI001AD8F80A|nr:FAD-binding domain-containing protein [Stappia indica]
MTSPPAPALQVVWFKRDLRTHDHEPLARAAERGPVLPLYVVEPELWQQPDISARHWAFVSQCLDALSADLGRLGQPLLLRHGQVVEVLARIHAARGIAALWSHQETGNGWTFARDRQVGAWCRAQGIPWHELRQDGVTRRLRSRDGWAANWERDMAAAQVCAPALAPLPLADAGRIPTAADLGLAADPCPGRQPGGRPAGLACLDSFLHRRGEPYRAAMSSPLLGFDACSRLSPHLAWGTLSLRETLQACRVRQRTLRDGPVSARGWRQSLSSFDGRLHWRSHFMQKLEDAPSLEFRNLHRAYDGLRPPAESEPARLAAWMHGETGLPFVDACMRALAATGWMNFRMRAMLMAVASYHLWLDWRRPGEHLARLFTDYEPGIHWPQVQMQSGTTGINTVRIYNPVKQGIDQDPAGVFTRRWVPELAPVPDRFLHEPWKWEGADGVLGSRYPAPVVDHLAAARHAREAVWGRRVSSGFRDAAARIQQRHGSRRAGLSVPGRTKRGSPDTRQLSLSLDIGGEDKS